MHLMSISKCVRTRDWQWLGKKPKHSRQVSHRNRNPVRRHRDSSLSDSLFHRLESALEGRRLHLLIRDSSPRSLKNTTPAITVVRLATGPKSVQKHPATVSRRSTSYTLGLWKLIQMMKRLVRLHSRKMATPKRRLLLRRDG